MTSLWKTFGFCLVVLGTLSACQWTSQMQLREGFGDAVRTNTAMHIIDPMAGKAPVPTTLDGQKAEAILDNYRTEQVEADIGGLVEDVGD